MVVFPKPTHFLLQTFHPTTKNQHVDLPLYVVKTNYNEWALLPFTAIASFSGVHCQNCHSESVVNLASIITMVAFASSIATVTTTATIAAVTTVVDSTVTTVAATTIASCSGSFAVGHWCCCCL